MDCFHFAAVGDLSSVDCFHSGAAWILSTWRFNGIQCCLAVRRSLSFATVRHSAAFCCETISDKHNDSDAGVALALRRPQVMRAGAELA